MPTRNRVKTYIPNMYYHVYNRGWNGTEIFPENEDYNYFESLLARHLSNSAKADSKGREYRHLRPVIKLNAYCLMPNHFHMLVYQTEEAGITQAASSILTAYTMYFNKKYRRRGSLFESTYKAVLITDDTQLMHITRYIHLNHSHFRTWPHSSYRDYFSGTRDWIDPARILELFSSTAAYRQFVDDYEELQRERDRLKTELAG